jgi:actin cytoskeleton-regulatory complex protein PAN1
LYIDKIGDILKDNMSKMGVYQVSLLLGTQLTRTCLFNITYAFQDYCVNQGAAIKFLQDLRTSNPELAARLQVS